MVNIFVLVYCSSSIMWAGPWRRAGGQHMKTASPEELIWSASTTRRRKIFCQLTAKAPQSGLVSSTTLQLEVGLNPFWQKLKKKQNWKLNESFCNLGYSWSDATPVSHTNWGPGEPNNHEGREDCVEMVSNTNGTVSWWNDLNCDAHQDWICMISKGKTPILPPVPPSPVPGKPSIHTAYRERSLQRRITCRRCFLSAPDCGSNPGWRKNNNICYYYNDTDIVDFHTAIMRCYAEKAMLVSILSKEEQAYVNTMVGFRSSVFVLFILL